MLAGAQMNKGFFLSNLGRHEEVAKALEERLQYREQTFGSWTQSPSSTLCRRFLLAEI